MATRCGSSDGASIAMTPPRDGPPHETTSTTKASGKKRRTRAPIAFYLTLASEKRGDRLPGPGPDGLARRQHGDGRRRRRRLGRDEHVSVLAGLHQSEAFP